MTAANVYLYRALPYTTAQYFEQFYFHLMCYFQHRFWSSITPRYFKHSVRSISLLFMFNFAKKSRILCLLFNIWKNEYCVLLTFSDSLFEINHWLILSNWRFVVSKSKLISLCLRNRLVSSLYMIRSNKFVAFFRSFTYSKNSSGPSIEFCGTPHVIVSSCVFSSSFIWMNCFLFDNF